MKLERHTARWKSACPGRPTGCCGNFSSGILNDDILLRVKLLSLCREIRRWQRVSVKIIIADDDKEVGRKGVFTVCFHCRNQE